MPLFDRISDYSICFLYAQDYALFPYDNGKCVSVSRGMYRSSQDTHQWINHHTVFPIMFFEWNKICGMISKQIRRETISHGNQPVYFSKTFIQKQRKTVENGKIFFGNTVLLVLRVPSVARCF